MSFELVDFAVCRTGSISPLETIYGNCTPTGPSAVPAVKPRFAILNRGCRLAAGLAAAGVYMSAVNVITNRATTKAFSKQLSRDKCIFQRVPKHKRPLYVPVNRLFGCRRFDSVCVCYLVNRL
jgi:hypothetical protein